MAQNSAPRNIILSAASATVNLTCCGFHIHAGDFLSAAKAYAPTARPASFVQHFLCCQSIELSLKAFLSLRGVLRAKLARQPYGHNLTRLLKDATAFGLRDLVDITPDDETTVHVANPWYDVGSETNKGKGKRFQYFDVLDAMRGFRDAPDAAPLQLLAEKLQAEKLRKTILRES